MHVCRFTHSDRALEPRLRSALEAALYQFFLAQPTADTPADTAEVEGEAVPSGLAELVADIAAGCEYRELTAGVPGLSEKVAHEAVSWCDQKWEELTDEDPFEEEEHALEAFRREGIESQAGSIQNRVRALWANYPESLETWKT